MYRMQWRTASQKVRAVVIVSGKSVYSMNCKCSLDIVMMINRQEELYFSKKLDV